MREFFLVVLTGGGSYLVGSISFALLIGRMNGIDIRRHGSGNVGATNIRRVLGKKWGIICFACDFAKGLLPVLVARSFGSQIAAGLLPALAAAAAIGGHVWPLFLRFKGGKGVATSLGAVLALAPWSVLAASLVWLLLFQTSRYVSVASIGAAVTLPLSALLLRLWCPQTASLATLAVLTLIGALIIVRHKQNILRLRRGEENRFVKEKKK